ncbi:MAG TPA: ABC transporter permease [Bryobacteraceae bacterium]|nr:ABC transporter permease [Bryobacteraceae bacterium]
MRRRRMLDSLDDDIRDHIERETRDNIERGMPPEEARYAAVRKFGNITRAKEDARAVWSRVWLEQLVQDLRYGLRRLIRNPGLAAVVILTLALGIGMNTAVFSVVHTVLLRPLACPHPERLVWIGTYNPNIKRDTADSPDFGYWREHALSFTAMAAYGPQQAAMTTPREAHQASGVVIAGDFWKLAGVRPALGRLFAPQEQNTVVLAWDLFERQFAADPRVIGKSVAVDGHPATITGVLPRDFHFQFPMWWQSLEPRPVEAYFPLPAKDIANGRIVNVVASLKTGVRDARALAELDVLTRRAHEGRGDQAPEPGAGLRVEPLADKLTGSARPALFVLQAAGAFVLLIAVLNIANVLLARATVRQREIAIRAAVGAGRGRVIRQLLAESVLLALIGGAAGLALAHSALAILIRLSPNAVPRLEEAAIDGAVLAFTLVVSVGTGILFGSGPALALRRANLQDALKDGARTSAGASGLRLRGLLVAVELALAIVLLIGAGLMLKSFWRMYAHPPGFVPESILTMKVRPEGQGYGGKPAHETYIRELLRRVEASPGVEAAGVSTWFLFAGVPFPSDSSPNQQHTIRLNAISPHYLKALGVRLLRGRWLNQTDSGVLLNESMARQAFGTVDPIGRQISTPAPATVVGIVSDLKYTQLDADAPPEIYIPYEQLPFLAGINLAVRTRGEALALAPAIRKLVSGIDPTQPVYDVKTLEQALSDSIAPRRFNLFLLGTFAGVALLLAVVGIYGVIAYSVAERTREIGVRLALGAQRRDVIRMVLRQGMTMAFAGLAAGLAGAWGLTRWTASLLYDVRPNDPATFTAVAGALAATAAVACWLPALKAARVDPVVALRYE